MNTPPPPADYFSHARPEMLRFVPTDRGRVLELGCASGAFGGALKHRQPTEVWGVEPDAEAARSAAARLDRVLHGRLEARLGELPTRHFDCVVCNDVLEHLDDPDATLRALIRVMAPNAVLVGSVPNVRYFPVLLDLVWNADWRYAEDGVLDRTHRRFFTRKSFARTLAEAGYAPQQIVGINPTASIKARAASMLSLGKLDDCRYLQFAFVATVRPA